MKEDSIPSNLSDGDEWADMVRYDQEIHIEETIKKKAELERKKLLVKETLDKQMKERNKGKLQAIEERKMFDQKLLKSMKEKEEQEIAKNQ